MTTLASIRAYYADEVRVAANLRSAALVDALASVPREDFLGPGPWALATPDWRVGGLAYRTTADADPRHLYHNVLVAIDAERQLNNGHPATLAACLDALQMKRGEVFVHIGCGVGYYTALGASIVGAEGRVVGVEIDSALAARARENLTSYPQVSVLACDGATFAEPCDAMLVNAGFTHPLPKWLDVLKPGGRLLLPIAAASPGSPISSGWELLVIRKPDERFGAEPIMPMTIFKSPTGRDETANDAILHALASGSWKRVASVRREVHHQTQSCVVHIDGACLSMQTP